MIVPAWNILHFPYLLTVKYSHLCLLIKANLRSFWWLTQHKSSRIMWMKNKFSDRPILVCETIERVPNLTLNCMFLSCHVRVSQWIHTLWLPECQGTPYSKQTQNLKFKWLNGTRTHNHVVRKRTLNHLAKLAKVVWVVVYELSGCGCESRRRF